MAKAILIDDERKSLVILKNKLDQHCPKVEVIATTQEPEEAIKLVEKLSPDLVFLDISMPKMSGFDVLSKIKNPDFELIFVTAYNDYGIEAIEHCAIGYLVKPVLNDKLVSTVELALKNIESKNALKRNQQLIDNLMFQPSNQKIIIPVQDGLEFIEISKIIGFEGEDGYTRIHFKDKESLLSSYRIGHFAKLLTNQNFFQIHKSYVINCDCIQKFLNEGYVLMANDLKFPVSRSRKTEFIESLKNYSA